MGLHKDKERKKEIELKIQQREFRNHFRRFRLAGFYVFLSFLSVQSGNFETLRAERSQGITGPTSYFYREEVQRAKWFASADW